MRCSQCRFPPPIGLNSWRPMQPIQRGKAAASQVARLTSCPFFTLCALGLVEKVVPPSPCWPAAAARSLHLKTQGSPVAAVLQLTHAQLAAHLIGLPMIAPLCLDSLLPAQSHRQPPDVLSPLPITCLELAQPPLSWRPKRCPGKCPRGPSQLCPSPSSLFFLTARELFF